jgi:hypothetical protein
MAMQHVLKSARGALIQAPVHLQLILRQFSQAFGRM